MENKNDFVQILKDVEAKYKGYKDGSIEFSEDEIKTIKCPKSFKYDSFVDLNVEKKK